MRPKIILTDVAKEVHYRKQSNGLLVSPSLNRKDKSSFFSLKHLSFFVLEGEIIGIVGLNGSGKSTLCHLLAEVISPTSGTIEINGKTSLISISAGLNNHLTGLENIELRCLVSGYNKAETNVLKDKIIGFADLGEYIHQSVGRYSSGMKSRLSFSINVYLKTDIIIIDEVLSLGDQAFYQKGVRKLNRLKQEGKTIVLISHHLTQVEELCDRVIWMNFGRIEKIGQTKVVLAEYKSFIQWFNSLTDLHKKIYRTEVLIEQSNESAEKNKKKKKDKFLNLRFKLQASVLIFFIIFSGASMFGVAPVDLVKHLFIKDTEEIKEPNRYEHDIHSNGLVKAMSNPIHIIANQNENKRSLAKS